MSEKRAALSHVSADLNRHIVNLLDSLSALADLADLPVSGLSRQELLHKALAALMHNQDLERCSIFLLEEESGELVNAAGLDWDDLLREEGACPAAGRPPTRFRVGEGIIGQAAASGELAESRAIAHDPRFKVVNGRKAGKPLDGSLLCVPIRSEEKVLGVLNVFYPVPDFFSIWHQRLLLLFCAMLGRLLINQQLFNEMERLVASRTAELVAANASLRGEVERRRRAEVELTEQHRFLQTVIDGSAEPIMVIGLDHRVLWMNRAARALAAPDRDELHFCHQISHHRESPCDSEEHPCPLKLVRESGEAVKVVHEHYDRQGRPRAVEILATPFPGPDGKLAGIIETSRDVTERVLTESRLRQQQVDLHAKAYYDHLTGLPNRLLFHLSLHHALTDPARPAALLFLDLDGFKAINDHYGHLFADRLLQLVAKRLRQTVREEDLVARFAGDEFVILLEKLPHPREDVGKVVDKLLASLGRPFVLDNREITVGASIGVSLFPADGSDPDQLLEKADRAMLRAKQEGKGACCLTGD